MESTKPSLIDQLLGRLTQERFIDTTVFVDHNSDFRLYFFQYDSIVKKSLRAKRKLERFCRLKGITQT